MLGWTHFTIGALITSITLQTGDPVLVGVGAIASLLCDIDTSKSIAGRVFFPISNWFEKKYAHRSVTHSFTASLFVGLTTYPLAIFSLVPLPLIHAVNIGYAAGYFADVLTPNGAPLFYPHPGRWVLPRNRKYRLRTGSEAEYGVLVALVLVTIIILWINNSSGGFNRKISNFLAQPNGVIELYNAKGADHLIIARIEGVRAVDRQPIKSEFQLIQQQGLGFLVKDNEGNIYKAGTDPDVQLITEKITGREGNKAQTLIKTLTFNDEAIAPQLQQLIQGNSGAQIYLTGQLQVDEPEELNISNNPQYFPIIIKSDSAVTLTAAPIENVFPLLSEQWVTGQLSARVVYVQ